MKVMLQLRSSEWLVLGYFWYTALVASFFVGAWKAWLLTGIVAIMLCVISKTPPNVRDWAPLAWTYIAYRQMDWFTPIARDHHLEKAWITWDRWLLSGLHMRAAIESSGSLLPAYLELCYALVYTVAPVSIAALTYYRRRNRVNRFWLAYLAGTLGSYALFPYFLSEPPRTAFSGADLPHIVTAIRRLNLWIAENWGIHSSVFPSAHVSAALSAAWGLLVTIPHRKRLAWCMAAFALSIAVAAVYGRYHYLADVISGIAVSFLGLAAAWVFRESREMANAPQVVALSLEETPSLFDGQRQ